VRLGRRGFSHRTGRLPARGTASECHRNARRRALAFLVCRGASVDGNRGAESAGRGSRAPRQAVALDAFPQPGARHLARRAAPRHSHAWKVSAVTNRTLRAAGLIPAEPVLGLDIGGANLKAAHSTGQAASVPFALWRDPERLADQLHLLIAS